MLHIWLPSQHADLKVWNDASNIWQKYSSWQKIADNFGKVPACLYFPSRHTLQLKTDLSNTQLRQLGDVGKQYLFEEMSLASVEKLQIREFSKSGEHYLYATAKNDIEQWHQSALIADIDITALLPDFLLLPTPNTGDNQVFIYHDELTTLTKQSEINGMAISFLPLVSEQFNLVTEIQVIEAVDGNSLTDNDFIAELNELDIMYASTNKTLEPIQNPQRHSLNFSMKNGKKSQLSSYVKVALMTCTLALMTQLLADGLSGYYYENAVKDTQRVSTKQFKSWFPEARINTRTSIERQMKPMLLSGNQADSGMMEVFNSVSPLIKQSNLKAIDLLIEKKSINLKLQTNNRRDLDSFISKLQQQGISAQLGAVKSAKSTDSKNKNMVTGSITINATQPET